MKKNQNSLNLSHVIHPFKPIFNLNSQILILGTFPSVVSRKENFYYAHQRNRFWSLITLITNNTTQVPDSISQKINLLNQFNIALWDVIYSCDIYKSSDLTIKNVVPNDLNRLISKTHISHLFANGNKAFDCYMKYCFNDVKLPITKLPSTSAANATYNFDRLFLSWIQIKNFF